MKCALSIAGSDPSGGAGIQADIKAMTSNGVYAMAVVTSLTAQNTTGVKQIYPLPKEFFEEQLKSVLDDIPPDAVKIGMLYSADIAASCAKILQDYGQKNIVVDPVMISTSGKPLLQDDARNALYSKIFPIASLLTPNVPEAEQISSIRIYSREDFVRSSQKIFDMFGCAVLIKGGHISGNADDFLFTGSRAYWFTGERIQNKNTHGTGCTLSSAIAANLAKGFSLCDAVSFAKEYVTGAIAAALDLGKGIGPMDHSFDIVSRFSRTEKK